MRLNITYQFNYVFKDVDGCELKGSPDYVMASDLGHALQKIAALFPDDAEKVEVWRTR